MVCVLVVFAVSKPALGTEKLSIELSNTWLFLFGFSAFIISNAGLGV